MQVDALGVNAEGRDVLVQVDMLGVDAGGRDGH
jgi:hypothetical protein